MNWELYNAMNVNEPSDGLIRHVNKLVGDCPLSIPN